MLTTLKSVKTVFVIEILLIKRTEVSSILHKTKVRFFGNDDITKRKFMFTMEMFSLCHINWRCEIFLAHITMSHRTQIICLVFEWLGVEVVKFYICQHKICSECSVFVSPECVTFIVEWLDRETKSLNFLRNIIQSILPTFLFSHR